VKKTAVAGISGGVDSAVCAALLKERGYEVTGVFLNIGGSPDRAAGVCDALGIPLEVIDIRERLERCVVTPFINGYLGCETPNPCVICNHMVKYPILAEAADRLGAEHIATGHYAGIVEIEGVCYLRKGHFERDQSYMLYRLPRSILSRCLFPVGDTPKSEVRAKAAGLGLAAADAPDSMEICFVPGNDYASFIRSRGGGMPEGDIVDVNGNVLGRHRGLLNYTVGQRRGLGVSSGGRLFVTALDAGKNQVVLGGEEHLYKTEIELRDMVWHGSGSGMFDVKVRHSPKTYRARVEGDTVYFDGGVKVTPGQSAVFYKDNIVMGGGVIC